MNHQFDELTKGLAQSVTRRAALKKFVKALLVATLGLCACAASGQPAVQAWVQRYSHTVDAWDYGQKVVTDSAGNVIVAGDTDTGTTGQDMFIIKYASSGATLWTNRYNGPGNDADVPTALAVDGSGNVYVTGSSIGSSGDKDFATIAYSSAGVALWTNRYNGLGNGWDVPTAIALDGSGNVYVTGSTSGSGDDSDYATIKYSSAGVALWTNRYDGQVNGDDSPSAVAVDGSGNVYVTGSSDDSRGYENYATVKYSSDGVELWVKRYSEPGNSQAWANALAVDGSGDVYVTGSSYSGLSDYDYATIKYSSVGVALWTNRYSVGNSYDLATALAVDGSGNVYVTGYSGSAIVYSYPDWVTVKYSSDGVQLWVNRYNGPGNDADVPTALAVDGSGNVYVTGGSFPNGSGSAPDYVTIAYSSGGVALWTNRFGGGDTPNALAADGGGNVYVTGTSIGSGGNRDCTTVKYSSAGVALWTNSYNGPAHGDSTAVALAVDGSGNVYVTGSSYSGLSDYDYATMKYSSAGLALWTNRYNGPGNSHDWATALAVDGSGNVYVTGSSIGSSGDKDFATIAYSSAGVALWTNRYNGPGNGWDFPTAIALDGSGNVYVTGSSIGSGDDSDYATIKYSSAGVALWTNRYDGQVNGDDDPNAVAVDGSGNVYVTGSSDDSRGYQNYATVKYSSDGVELWVNRYKGPGNSQAWANALAVDGSGNVYVTGNSYDNASGSGDYATIKYSSAGVAQWTNNGGGSTLALAVDGSGNVYVTGYTSGSTSDYDYATMKYSSAGLALWTNRYNGPGNSHDLATALAVDGSGNVYVTGSSIGSGGDKDFATIAYSSDGVALWTNRYNGPCNGDDFPETAQSIALSPDGSVYVTGSSDGDYTGGVISDFVTIKYAPSAASVRLTITPDGSGGYFISFNGNPGSAYRLQRASQLTGPWLSSAPQTAPASGLVEFWDLFPPPGQGFYRTIQP